MGCVRCVDRADFGENPTVENVNFTGKIAESCECNQATLRIEGYEVVRRSPEIVQSSDSLIE
jgi:hypothetical protein